MSEYGVTLLWTAMPVELVVDGLFPATPALVEMEQEGRILQVLPGAEGMGTVCRLISTNPRDYLDPRWQPGAAIAVTASRNPIPPSRTI